VATPHNAAWLLFIVHQHLARIIDRNDKPVSGRRTISKVATEPS